MKKISIIIAFVAIVVGIYLHIPYKTFLVFEKENSKEVLAYHSINENEVFTISYTHSIHLSEVVEKYKVSKKDQIILTELIYESYGIGMPSNAYGNEKFEKKDGKIYITKMNRTFQLIDVRISKVVANHQLVIKKNHIQLEEYLNSGSWVRIKFRKLNAMEVLKGVNLYERKS